jgi:hypothetical protein
MMGRNVMGREKDVRSGGEGKVGNSGLMEQEMVFRIPVLCEVPLGYRVFVVL